MDKFDLNNVESFMRQILIDFGLSEENIERLKSIPFVSMEQVDKVLKEFKDDVEESNKKE